MSKKVNISKDLESRKQIARRHLGAVRTTKPVKEQHEDGQNEEQAGPEAPVADAAASRHDKKSGRKAERNP